jgi:hypothetical protein
MWQLKRTNAAKEWVDVGTFDTASLKGIRRQACTDEEAFSVLHHTGRRALYGVKRRMN